ncbi:MAG: tetratricopeptide repeat protein [Vicinamibacteria bacterium]
MISRSLAFLVALAWSALPAVAQAPVDHAQAYYHFSLGQQARLVGDGEKALEELRKALRIDPGAADIRAELARQLRDAGRVDEALAEAKRAVAGDKESLAAHRVLAQLYQGQVTTLGEEAFTKAAAEYEEVLRLEPEDGNSLLVLGAIYGQLQRHADGVRIWEQYLQLDPGNFDAHLRLGTSALATGDVDRATSALRKALELEPDSSRAYQKLGEIFAQAQQTEQAVLHFRKALELDPEQLRVRLQLGDVLFAARRYAEAEAEAEAVLKEDAKNRFALDLKGRSLREMKDFDGASAAADRALAADANDLRAQFLKVTVAEARQDYVAAAAGLQAILSRNRAGEEPAEAAGNDRIFYARLGLAYQQLGRPADAAEAFRKAAAASPGDTDSELAGLRIEALLQAKQLDRALSEARDARARFQGDAELTVLEAIALRDKGDQGAADAIVARLRQESPKEARVLAQVARYHQRGKNFAAAEEVLRVARELEPKSLSVLFQLGAVLERQKKLDAAEAVFREALALQPDSAPVLNYLGYMNVDRGVRLPEALGLIEKALAIDPENGAYLDSLGWAYYRLGRYEEAERTLRRAAGKPGANAVVLSHLGDALAQRGATDEAVEYWQKALVGEDEDGELDRPAVERKIREAQLRPDGSRPR